MPPLPGRMRCFPAGFEKFFRYVGALFLLSIKPIVPVTFPFSFAIRKFPPGSMHSFRMRSRAGWFSIRNGGRVPSFGPCRTRAMISSVSGKGYRLISIGSLSALAVRSGMPDRGIFLRSGMLTIMPVPDCLASGFRFRPDSGCFCGTVFVVSVPIGGTLSGRKSQSLFRWGAGEKRDGTFRK